MFPLFDTRHLGREITYNDIDQLIGVIVADVNMPLEEFRVGTIIATSMLLDVYHGRRACSSEAFDYAKNFMDTVYSHLPS